jgi:hypothetical protein
MGGDERWSWHWLAQTYAYLGRRPEYSDALARLRKLDADGATQVEKDYGRPEEESATVGERK